MRRLLVFALLLLAGGGVGWSVYEWQRDRATPPRDDAASGQVNPAEPAQAGATGSAARTDAAPAPEAPEEREQAAGAPLVVAPLPKVAEPEGHAEAEPQAAAPPGVPRGGDEGGGRAPDAGEAAGERWLSFESIRRALEPLFGDRGARQPETESPSAAGEAKTALADLKGEPDPAAEAAAKAKPSFDVVRIARDGMAVMAGRAEPGAEVEIRAGERVIDRVTATRGGSWVSTPLEPIQAGDRELSLAARTPGEPAVLSDQVVVVALPKGHGAQALKPGQAGAAVVEVEAGADAASSARPISPRRGPEDPVAVLLPKDDARPGRVLQAPGRIGSDGELVLLVLDYDDSGRVRLSGEGAPGAPVRIYVDNQPAGEFSVAQDGTWRAVLHERLEAGTYTLRLDQLGPSGRPTARLETPFTRASHPPAAGKAEVDYVIVQPGNSLWRISRRLFGHGFRHVHIFEANRGQIRDPDLIYPGQVFEVPAALTERG
jgi:nucleoid-associated protein YgaU